jgi:phage head maturation protease
MNDRELRCYSGEFGQNSRAISPRGSSVTVPCSTAVRATLGLREIIKPGAFDDVLTNDVRGLFNHDPNFILGAARRERYR